MGELIGALSRVTAGVAGYDMASDVSAVVGSLGDAVRSLGRVLDQAAEALDLAAGDGRLSMDGSAPVGVTPAAVSAEVRQLATSSADLATRIIDVHALTACVTGRLTVPVCDSTGHDWSEWRVVQVADRTGGWRYCLRCGHFEDRPTVRLLGLVEVYAILDRAGVDHTSLRIEVCPDGVRVVGDRDDRHRAASAALSAAGLSQAPYRDHTDWSHPDYPGRADAERCES